MIEEQKTALRIWLAECRGWTEIQPKRLVGRNPDPTIPKKYHENFCDPIPPLDLNNMPAFEAAVMIK